MTPPTLSNTPSPLSPQQKCRRKDHGRSRTRAAPSLAKSRHVLPVGSRRFVSQAAPQAVLTNPASTQIKCNMDESGPPCKRCTERNLSCKLNKSLQTMIDERGEWRHALTGDLEHMHSALQGVLSQMALPSLPPLQTPHAALAQESPQTIVGPDDVGPSCDNSPRLTPRDDALPHVPIESLYQITRLRALRSDDAPNEPHHSPTDAPNQPLNDFITQGLVSSNDAERLVNLYLHRIDHFMYMIGSGPYRDLESMRRASSILTAAVCTVAALHDPMSSHLYGICSREFRRLMSASMFDRRIDRDHMRAMVRISLVSDSSSYGTCRCLNPSLCSRPQ